VSRGAALLALVAIALPASLASGQSAATTAEIYRALLNGANALSPTGPDRKRIAGNLRGLEPMLSDRSEVPARAAFELVRIWDSFSLPGQLTEHLASDPLSHEIAAELFEGTSIARFLPRQRFPARFRVENRRGLEEVDRSGRWVSYQGDKYALWYDGTRYLAQKPPDGDTLYLRAHGEAKR
jgi:hypothetical protein